MITTDRQDLNKMQQDMIKSINKQLEGSNKEARYILEGFTEDELHTIGSFILSFY